MTDHQEPTISRKRRCRNRRASAIPTRSNFELSCPSSTKTDLETAKAAAMKLLDHSSELLWSFDPAKLINEELVLDASSVNKRNPIAEDVISSNSSTSNLNRVSEETQTESKNQSTHHALHSPSIDATPAKYPKPKSKSTISLDTLLSSGSQSIVNLPKTCLSSSSPPKNVQSESFFHATREEVFSDTAITDAFNAAMKEFSYHARVERNSSGITLEGPAGSEDAPIALPQSSIDQRRVSALYYGQPPPCPVLKTKNPRPTSIFLPRLPVSSNTANKQAEAKEEGRPDVREEIFQSSPRRGSESSGSDIDMDDYWDMMGSQSDCESVAVLVQNVRSTSATNSTHEIESKSFSSTTSHTNPIDTISSFTSSIQVNGDTSGANNRMNTDILTDSQKILLTNTLNAQYWAGYHAAILNHSLGIKLTHSPILIPQIGSNHDNDNTLTSFSFRHHDTELSASTFSTPQTQSSSH